MSKVSHVIHHDPTKMIKVPKMLCMGVYGSHHYEAKMRNPNKAFTHMVTWKEFEPFVLELYKTMIKKHPTGKYSSILKFIGREEIDKDLSWENIFQDSYKEICPILERIVIARNKKRDIKLKRGDVVEMDFVNYKGCGMRYWDGKHVIPGRSIHSDYDAVPSTFKIPTKFPRDYWGETSHYPSWGSEDYCFDIAAVTTWGSLKICYDNDKKFHHSIALAPFIVEKKDGKEEVWVLWIDSEPFEEKYNKFQENGLFSDEWHVDKKDLKKFLPSGFCRKNLVIVY